MEKVWVVYIWVFGYLQYDYQVECKGQCINQNLWDILDWWWGLCMDYVLLYQAICCYVGLQCEKVDGYVVFRFVEGWQVLEKVDYVWNVVWVDG